MQCLVFLSNYLLKRNTCTSASDFQGWARVQTYNAYVVNVMRLALTLNIWGKEGDSRLAPSDFQKSISVTFCGSQDQCPRPLSYEDIQESRTI